MTLLTTSEIIDLTNEQDSEEDVLVNPKPPIKKKKKIKQFSSVYRSQAVEFLSAGESLSKSVSSPAQISGTGSDKTSAIRNKPSANEKGTLSSFEMGMMPIIRKKTNVTSKSLGSTSERAGQEPKMPKRSQTKDTPRFVGHGKASVTPKRPSSTKLKDHMKVSHQSRPQLLPTEGESPNKTRPTAYKRQNQIHNMQTARTPNMADCTRKSSTRPSMSTIMPNGGMETIESRKSMVQKVDKSTEETAKTRTYHVNPSVCISKNCVTSDATDHPATTDREPLITRKVEKNSISSDTRTAVEESPPLSNQTLEKSHVLSFDRATGTLDYDSDSCVTDSSDFVRERRRSKRKRLDSSSTSQDHRTHEIREELNQVCISPTNTVQFASVILGREKTRVTAYPLYSRGSLLRNRDLGGPSHLDMQQSFMRTRDSCLDTTIQLWKEWTGASKDVIRAAWAPDGLSFLIGSSTDLDAHNVQFNRSNNLLWCDMVTNTIIELDNHKIERSAYSATIGQETIELSRILDPYIFTTVSDICYSQDSTRFWTSSYDRTVKIWDVENESPKCIRTVLYPNQVDILARCDARSVDLVASAQKSTSTGVQIYEFEVGEIMAIPDPNQAEKYRLVPTALAWGSPATATGALLAAGYGEKDVEAVRYPRGDIVIWNAEAETKLTDLISRYQYVYDLAWHMYQPWLAAAIPTKEKTHAGLQGTQSHIRIWEPSVMDRYIYDLDCLALDINKIILNPIDAIYVSAACTDGIVYHYDLRQPQQILAKFKHDLPISQLDPHRSRESQDFGIQFISWNAAGTLLYSGSSDGKVKQWNPYLNNEDAFIEDVATLDAGISSGCFSPDFTNLLIGTNKGSAHVFSSAPVTPWADDVEDRVYDEKEEEQEENEKRIQKSRDNSSSSFKYRAARTNFGT